MIKNFSFIVFAVVFSTFAATAQEPNAAKENSAIEKNALSYGVVVDNSGSYRQIFETVIKSVGQIAEANEANDEAFLVRFVDNSHMSLLQDFTRSKSELQSAAEEMFIEGGQTAILDAVYFSARHLAEAGAADRRKVLILVTDGEDRKSRTKIETLLNFLKGEKIRVFALGLSDAKVNRGLLDKLAKETGGKSFIVEKPAERETLIKQLNSAVRAQ